MAKNTRPEVNNPLANMGLDEIVRGITAPDKVKKLDTGASEVQDIQKEGKRRRKGRKALEENLAKYTGVSEQGDAVWLPKEVKKRLELIRISR